MEAGTAAEALARAADGVDLPHAAGDLRARIDVAANRLPGETQGVRDQPECREVVGDAHSELTPGSSHVKEGFYFQRMKRYYDLFDREQIKIYLFDDSFFFFPLQNSDNTHDPNNNPEKSNRERHLSPN